jgi:hypothetical protein
MLLILLLLATCSDKVSEPPQNPSQDWPPTMPAAIAPLDGAEDIGPDFTLAWDSHDPDGGAVLYNLYFGADSLPVHEGVWSSSNSLVSPWALQEKARQFLRQVGDLQRSYQWNNGSYCLNGAVTMAGDSSFFPNLGIVPESDDRYVYSMLAAADRFRCTATANTDFDPAVDSMIVNEANTLASIINDIDILLLPNTYYYWHVIARDDEGNRSEGPVWKFRTGSTEINHYPENPILISPPDGSTQTLSEIVFSWECSDPDGDRLGYFLYFNENPYFDWWFMSLYDINYVVLPLTSRVKMREMMLQIYQLQSAYHEQNGSYCLNGAVASRLNNDGFGRLGITIDSMDVYVYSMVATNGTFTCVATADLDDDATIDTWTINQDGELECIIDDFYLILREPNNTTYFWRIAARDDHGHTSMSPTWSFIATGPN